MRQVKLKTAEHDNKRLRTIELWLNAALLLIAAIGVMAIGAFAMQFLSSGTSNPPASARAAGPVGVSAPVSPAVPTAATSPTPAALAPSGAAPAEPAALPTIPAPPPAVIAAQPASTPPAESTRLPTSATPAAAPARAAPAPSASDVTRRRCAALADYVADLNRQGGANAPPWVGEQIDTAVSRQRELGC